MVAAPLVESQIKDGEAILKQLDRDRFGVEAALWLYDTEREGWFLIIAAKRVSKDGPRASYAKFRESLDAMEEKIKTEKLQVSLVEPKYPLLNLLRTAIQVESDFASIRFTNNTINGHLIEDALIYRLH